MPINYSRRLTGRSRSAKSNRHLGVTLAFVAGATNAGAFLAVQQYTSHMTGIVSAMADNVALGRFDLVLAGLGGLLSFIAGAACTAIMINFSRRQRLHSVYAMPLLLEAMLLLCFGLLGARLSAIEGFFVPMTIMLLCFIMGLQNAVVTKMSNSVIRTTHVTGMVTDIGIELGKLAYWNSHKHDAMQAVRADRDRLVLLSLLTLSFFAGGLFGAFGFKHLGYSLTVPLAFALVMLASIPALDDLRVFARRLLRP